MRNADAAPMAFHSWLPRYSPAFTLIASIACGSTAVGCAERCRDEDPDRSAAFRAAWAGDIEALLALTAQNPELANARPCPAESVTGRLLAWQMGAGTASVLHVASRQGHDRLVMFLLTAGADVEARDESVATPLHLAAQYGHEEVVRLLLDVGARIDARRTGGLTLSKGVDIHVRDKYGRTPLELAIVDLLLAAGADVEVRGKDGSRPLHTAAVFGRADVAELLLDRGAQVDARNDSGWTPLHFAAGNDEADMVALLLKRGADVEARNNSGRTPLREVHGNARIEALLKSAGTRR